MTLHQEHVYRSESPRTPPNPRSGQTVLEPRLFTLLLRVRVPFRRSPFKPILRCKHESSPRSVTTSEGPSKKKGPTIFFSRRESAIRDSYETTTWSMSK